jgi:hypothetical protein
MHQSSRRQYNRLSPDAYQRSSTEAGGLARADLARDLSKGASDGGEASDFHSAVCPVMQLSKTTAVLGCDAQPDRMTRIEAGTRRITYGLSQPIPSVVHLARKGSVSGLNESLGDRK